MLKYIKFKGLSRGEIRMEITRVDQVGVSDAFYSSWKVVAGLK